MVWLPPPTGHTNMPNIALLTSAHSLEACPSVMLYFPGPCYSNLAYFGFLRVSEFTVPSSSDFNPLLHLTSTYLLTFYHQDLQV